MNKKMSRFKGLYLSCVSVLMIVLCICSFSFESKASELDIFPEGHTFYLNYPEPGKSPTQGYVHVLLYNQDTSNYYVVTYFWTISSKSEQGPPTAVQGMVTLTNSTFEFNVHANSGTTSLFYTLYHVNARGEYRCVQASSTDKYMRDWDAIYGGDVTLMGWRSGGNAYVKGANFSTDFTVYYSEDGSARLLMDILDKLSDMSIDNNVNATDIWLKLTHILESSNDIEEQLQNVLTYIESIDGKLIEIDEDLEYLMKRADRMVNLQKDTNTWLEKIWNSIQEFINPSDEDKQDSDKLQDESNDKTDKLDDLNEQNKTDKVSPDDAVGSIEDNIDFDAIDTFKNIFVYITENEYILQMLLLVFSVALVAYVLFGKK